MPFAIGAVTYGRSAVNALSAFVPKLCIFEHEKVGTQFWFCV